MDRNDVKKETTRESVEYRRRQISEIKTIVYELLEEADEIEAVFKAVQQTRKYLRMDIDDLKEGRLDRMHERQKMDKDALKAAVVLLKQVDVKSGSNDSPYYRPYSIEWCGGRSKDDSSVDVNSALARQHASGAYKLKRGEVVHVR